MNFLKRLIREERGQDLIEYTLLLGFICLAGVAVYSTISGNLTTIWGQTNDVVQQSADAAVS